MNFLDTALDDFQDFTKNHEQFISNDGNLERKIELFLKQNYDFTNEQQTQTFKSNSLPELIIDNMDVEQIWQQVELENDAFLAHAVIKVSKLVVTKDRLIFHEVQADPENNREVIPGELPSAESSSESEEDDNEPLNLEEDSDDLHSDDLTDNEQVEQEQPLMKKFKPSAVDDKFFKLDEMEAFLQAEERRTNEAEPDSGNDTEEDDEEEDGDGAEDVDLFSSDVLENNDTERGGKNNPKYKDFFMEQDEPNTSKPKRNKFLEEVDPEEEDESEHANDEGDVLEQDNDERDESGPDIELQRSTFEERTLRSKLVMDELEQAAISEKPWQLQGEIRAENRPQNSLLEEVVEFDLSSRPAPVMTEEVSLQLEDIIRQRIKDKTFDSVKRKEKPAETPLEYKKKLVLEQEKSKESLAQIYEKEFLAQQEALDPDAADKEEEEPQLHKDIKKMLNGLFSKLDALSNFHFTPKPVQPELKIISNLPAISMEEVAPVATSEAALLAPEEVRPKVRGDIIGKTERTTTDKNRERRKKKNKQHMHAVLKQKKEQLGLGNKYSKAKAQMLENDSKEKNVERMDESHGSKSVKSSTAFFSQLEEEVRTQIKNKNSTKIKQKETYNAKKLKL